MQLFVRIALGAGVVAGAVAGSYLGESPDAAQTPAADSTAIELERPLDPHATVGPLDPRVTEHQDAPPT